MRSLLLLMVRTTQPHSRQAGSTDCKRICKTQKQPSSLERSPNVHPKNQQVTLQLALSGKRLEVKSWWKGAKSRDESPARLGRPQRSANTRDSFELFITQVEIWMFHIQRRGRYWRLHLSLIRQIQCSGTVYPCEHLTPAPGAKIRCVLCTVKCLAQCWTRVRYLQRSCEQKACNVLL